MELEAGGHGRPPRASNDLPGDRIDPLNNNSFGGEARRPSSSRDGLPNGYTTHSREASRSRLGVGSGSAQQDIDPVRRINASSVLPDLGDDGALGGGALPPPPLIGKQLYTHSRSRSGSADLDSRDRDWRDDDRNGNARIAGGSSSEPALTTMPGAGEKMTYAMQPTTSYNNAPRRPAAGQQGAHPPSHHYTGSHSQQSPSQGYSHGHSTSSPGVSPISPTATTQSHPATSQTYAVNSQTALQTRGSRRSSFSERDLDRDAFSSPGGGGHTTNQSRSSSYLSPFGTDPVGIIGRHKPREVLRVERDYSVGGDGCQFWSGWVMELEGRITPTEFQNTLNELNSVLASAHDPYKSCIDNCLAVLTLYLSPHVVGSHFQREMTKFTRIIERANKEIYNPAGLNILHPKQNAFLFLEIEYY